MEPPQYMKFSNIPEVSGQDGIDGAICETNTAQGMTVEQVKQSKTGYQWKIVKPVFLGTGIAVIFILSLTSLILVHQVQVSIPEWSIRACNTESKLAELREKVNVYEQKVADLQEKVLQSGGWVTAFDKYRYLIMKKKASWHQAKKLCEDKQADLAAKGMRNSSIRSFIYNLVGDDYFWIGLADEAEEGMWVWADGEESNSSNTDWHPGEPNGLTSAEDCGFILRGGIIDGSCADRYSSICEMEFESSKDP